MEAPVRLISYKRHRFQADVIRHAVWLYFRFTLSLRDVEELLAQRGIEVSYETIRCWTLKFGGLFAPPAALAAQADGPLASGRDGSEDRRQADVPMARRRRRGRGPGHAGPGTPHKAAALKLLRKLLRSHGVHPETIVTDKLASYRAAARDLGLTERHRSGGMRETIGRKTRICRCEGGSGSSRNSSPGPRLRDSSPPTPPSTTSSISSLI